MCFGAIYSNHWLALQRNRSIDNLREVGPSRKILHARGVGSERRKSVTRVVGSWGALGETRKIKIPSLISYFGRSRGPSFWVRVCALFCMFHKDTDFKKVFFFAQNAWKHMTRWDSGGAQGRSNWQPICILWICLFHFNVSKMSKYITRWDSGGAQGRSFGALDRYFSNANLLFKTIKMRKHMLGWDLRCSKIAPLTPKAYATVRSWWCLIGFQRMSMMCSNDLKAYATVGSWGCSRLLFWRSWSVPACAVLSGIHRFMIFVAMEGSKEQGREGKSISL